MRFCTAMLFFEWFERCEHRDKKKKHSSRSKSFVLVWMFPDNSLLKSKVFELRQCMPWCKKRTVAFSLSPEQKSTNWNCFGSVVRATVMIWRQFLWKAFEIFWPISRAPVLCQGSTSAARADRFQDWKRCEDRLSMGLIAMPWRHTMLAKDVCFV